MWHVGNDRDDVNTPPATVELFGARRAAIARMMNPSAAQVPQACCRAVDVVDAEGFEGRVADGGAGGVRG